MSTIRQSAESIPPVLDLLSVADLGETAHVLAGERVFVTSVEFWTNFTGIRLMWPVQPSASFEELWPTAVVAGDQRYGCGQWRVGGIRTHSDMFVTTDLPIYTPPTTLMVEFPVGQLQIPIRG